MLLLVANSSTLVEHLWRRSSQQRYFGQLCSPPKQYSFQNSETAIFAKPAIGQTQQPFQ
jgi:hypothetical protein